MRADPFGVLAESWARHRALLLPAYVGGVAVCLGAALAGGGLHYYVDFHDGQGRFSGVMTLASGFSLAAFGWSFLSISHLASEREERLGWVSLGLFGMLLAFDEVGRFHEAAASLMARFGIPGPLGLDRDLYVFGAYAVMAGVILWHQWPHLRRAPDLALPTALACAAFALSQCVDMFIWDAVPAASKNWVGGAEEGLKCLGSWSLALIGLMLPRTPIGSRRR